MHVIRLLVLTVIVVLGTSEAAHAQSGSQGAGSDEGWQVAVSRILGWVPLAGGRAGDVPPSNGSAGSSGQIIESRFDGAFFGGVTATNGAWRIEGYGIWAGVGGDRADSPFLQVDLDLIYGDARVGRRIAPALYLTAGVRRLAFKYQITIADLPRLSRTPGVWDPLVGIGWHHVGSTFEWHAAFEGGGFGVGSDVDLGGSVRVDWKPLRHFGLTAGYNFLYLKVSDSVAGREVTVEPTVHGPSVGIGFYF